jgi:hypothetical protein
MLEQLVGAKAKQFTENALRNNEQDEEVDFGDDEDSGEDTVALKREGMARMEHDFDILQNDIVPGMIRQLFY